MRRFAFALVTMGIAIALAGGILGLSAYTGQAAARVRWEKESTSKDVGAAEALTRLSFPSQGKDFFVAEGATKENLLLGPSRVEWSGTPGAKGNSIIAAHRDTHFRMLKDLKKGELIDVERRGRTFQYRIVALEVVEANDRQFYGPTTVPALTLVTCYPFYYLGSAPKRFIVRAELVDPSS
jgi:sortase A